MSQKYYEYSHYKEQDEQGPQKRPPRGSHARYLLVFQAIFYSFFHVSAIGSPAEGGIVLDSTHYSLFHRLLSPPEPNPAYSFHVEMEPPPCPQ